MPLDHYILHEPCTLEPNRTTEMDPRSPNSTSRLPGGDNNRGTSKGYSRILETTLSSLFYESPFFSDVSNAARTTGMDKFS